jgi:uncharacterized repeat protein (TIGR03803 family)
VKTQTNKILPCALALTALTLNLSVLQPARAQTFTLDNPMLVARWNHTATLLTNGLVLIAGGMTANVYPDNPMRATNSSELYDPATGTSTLTGFMTDAQASHIAILLTNGLVLVAGGRNDGGGILSRAELYDPNAGTWADTGYLNQERSSFAAVLLSNGKVLVVGGYSNSGDISSAEIYDPISTVWTNAAPMNYATDSQTATRLPNGKVLVAGGSDSVGGSLTNSVLYDPVNNTWTNTSPLKIARAAHVATLLPNGKVLVVGGEYSGSAEVYDPSVGTWTLVAPMNEGRGYPSATLLPNGQVLVLGGFPGQTSAELYDSTNNTWTYTGSLNVGRVFHTATLVADGQVVVAGGDAGTIGYYNGPAMADVETYNQAVQFSLFSFALNTTNLTWVTGGDLPWFTETTVTLDGLAAESGPITDSQSSYLETTVPADGQLSFNWKVSSEDGYDYLTFYINGNAKDAISGEVDWNQETYPVFAGNVLRWEYGKDDSGSDGLDAGFLDEVIYVTAPPGTGLTVTASPLTGPAPLTVQFTSPSMDNGGNTVTNWNWNFGDGTTSTVQSPSHIYTNFGSFASSLAAYSTYGAAPLSITGPGTITVTNHTLNVTASPQAGALPLTVQFASPGVDSGGNTVTNWFWNFGDGASSTSQNPTHVYTSAAAFSPSLVARSTYGASPLAVAGPGTVTVNNPPNPAFRILYSFSPAFGSDPNGGLTLSGNILYGTTSTGGASNSGTLFAINTSGSGFTNIYSFNSTTGASPNGVVLSGSTLYGPTDFGGNRGGGTVFAISTNGTGYTNLFNLNSAVDPNSPSEPQAPLVLAGDTLYGATWFGGGYDHGTVFSVATNGAGNGILHSFITPAYNPYANNYDGIFPSARLCYSGGTLYGTAEQGGIYTYSGGTIFSVVTNQPGSFSILHYFSSIDPTTGTNSDGAFSFSGLVLSGSTLYGTTFGGGTYGNGTVFAVNINTLVFSNLYSFIGGNDGSDPHAGLTLSGNTLYGTTSAGGTAGKGTLFAIKTDGSGYTSLYSFSGGSDGADPESELVLSGNTLYGTANGGGDSSGDGTVFSFTLPSPLLLTNLVKLPGGSFQFSFLNTASTINTVFATTNLALAFSNWTSLGTATEVSSGHFQFTDPQANNNSKRFYRVRSP